MAILVAPSSVAVRYRIPRRKREHSEQVVFPSESSLHNAVGVFFDDFIFYAQLLKVGWQDMFRETRLLLIEVDGDQ